MIPNCVRVVLLGLVAAATATAQSPVFVDLTGRTIDFDLVTLSVQSRIEAIAPVVRSIGNVELSTLGNAWVDKFQKAVMAGTMTVQQNADDYNEFLTGAAAISPAYAANIKTANSKSQIEFFQFHQFMPAATWDALEYGVANSKVKYNVNRLAQMRMLMMASVNSQPIASLQIALNNYLNLEEKQNPGFIKAVSAVLQAAMKTVWANNPVRAPTAAPVTKAPTTTTAASTTKPTSATPAAKPTTTSAATMTVPPTVAPDLSVKDSTSVEASAPESASTPTASAVTPAAVVSTPTPTTTTSSASVASATSAVAGVLVLVVATALV